VSDEHRRTAGGAGRVIAGSARGVRLRAPGPGTRPLTDRVKEALFAILEPSLRGARVLDLCAGSGAGAIEAISRGAASAVLVERDAAAVAVIRENLARARIAPMQAQVVRADALVWLRSQHERFDVVLFDPPYGDPLLESGLEVLGQGTALAPAAVVVAKHFWRHPPPARAGLLASERERRFGETALTFYRVADAEPGGEDR
jgi:16S rRNA (guanine(966)-N(2))-methyltransferase RsmD